MQRMVIFAQMIERVCNCAQLVCSKWIGPLINRLGDLP